MLTPELIQANETLATLTPEQIAAITTLSANDEQTILGTKIGELHGRYDQDIKAVTGLDKAQGEKSYDFVKRVLTDFKTKASGAEAFQQKATQYETEISTLKQQIADGKGGEVLKTQLADAMSQLKAIKDQHEADKQTWTAKEAEFGNTLTSIKVNTEFDSALSGLKFKAEYPEAIQKTLLKAAKDSILGNLKPDWVEVDGKKVMVFRDEKGDIKRNANNALNPYTVKELISEQLKDVLDLAGGAKGAGSKEPKGGNVIAIADIGSAKTQVEADEMISKHLMQIGLVRGSAEFAEKQKEIRIANKVSSLPLR